MNNKDRKAIEACAVSILKKYREAKESSERYGATMFDVVRGYRDSLEAMKRNGLLEDYNLLNGTCVLFESSGEKAYNYFKKLRKIVIIYADEKHPSWQEEDTSEYLWLRMASYRKSYPGLKNTIDLCTDLLAILIKLNFEVYETYKKVFDNLNKK
jgi:hypothetical protein